ARRISFRPQVAHNAVISLLKNYHVLAVPSRGLETGPLVVLESFAAGTPVIGCKLGGILEWVKHQCNGLLAEPEDIQAWSDIFRQCAEDRALLARLREGVKMPRRMSDVATDMVRLYERRVDSAAHSHL